MSNESPDHYHEDGNLVPSSLCGFCFEAAFQRLYMKKMAEISVDSTGISVRPRNKTSLVRRDEIFSYQL